MRNRLFLALAVACGAGLLAGCATQKTKPLTSAQVIQSLKLTPMPDEACKGYWLPTYESRTQAATPTKRAASSLIYYLMTPEYTVDPWHRISSDEILLYHAGAPMIQLLLYPGGKWEELTLGPDLANGHVMQKVIPAGTWMGFVLKPTAEYDWGLYGVMVSPGFHVDDLEMALKPDETRQVLKSHPAAIPRARALGLYPK